MAPSNDATTADGYLLDRGYRESSRLYLQHYVWGQNFGWQLHPQIPWAENTRVIDVAAGNCGWLLEAARLLPASATLVGVDISDKQFPPRQYIPSNIQLDTMDALGKVPDKYVGAFDVVHMRMISTLVKNNDPSRILGNAMLLLRPGGYLQWDELDGETLSVHSPESGVSFSKTEYLLQRWYEYTLKMDCDWRWLSRIPRHLRAEGAFLQRFERAPILPELYKVFTDEVAFALLDMGLIASTIDVGLLGTAEEWKATHEAMLRETAQGVGISMEMMVAVARKPEHKEDRTALIPRGTE